MEREQIISEILSRCDGPVNRLTAISRAIAIAAAGQATQEDAAEALCEALEELDACGGSLDTNEFPGASALG